MFWQKVILVICLGVVVSMAYCQDLEALVDQLEQELKSLSAELDAAESKMKQQEIRLNQLLATIDQQAEILDELNNTAKMQWTLYQEFEASLKEAQSLNRSREIELWITRGVAGIAIGGVVYYALSK